MMYSQWLKGKITIRVKLVMLSTILSITGMCIIYLALQKQSINLIIEERTRYEQNNFLEIRMYIESFFKDIEKKVQDVYKSPAMKHTASQKENIKNFVAVREYMTEIDKVMENSFYDNKYIDEVMIFLDNDFAYNYSIGSFGQFISEDFNFQSFIDELNIPFSKELQQVPFYYENEKRDSYKNEYQDKIYKQLDKKMLYIQGDYSTEGQLKALIIITIDTDFISDSYFIKRSNDMWSLYDTNQEKEIWNKGTIDYTFNDQSDMLTMNQSLFNEQWIITNQMSKDKLEQKSSIALGNVLSYFFVCLFLVVTISIVLSTIVTKPLNKLAQRFADEGKCEVSGDYLKKKVKMWSITSLKTKIIIYFIISSLIPNLIFMILVFSKSYTIYKNDIIDMSIDTSEFVKHSIDVMLNDLDEVIKATIYSAEFQNCIVELQKEQYNSNYSKLLDEFISNAYKKNRYFRSFDLYDPRGKNIYFHSDNNQSYSNELVYTFKELMDDSEGRLTYLGGDNQYYYNAFNSFGRKLGGVSEVTLNKKIGYAVFSFDENMFNSIYRDIEYV